MKRSLVYLAALGALLAGCAQEVEDFPNEQSAAPPQAEEQEQIQGGIQVQQGIVTAVDRELGEITIDHVPVAEMGWPAGTHGFEVADRAMLGGIQVDDAVRFAFVESETGEYVIQDLAEE